MTAVPPPRLALIAMLIAAAVASLAAQRRGAGTGDGARSLGYGGRVRTYLVHDFARTTPAPVVIVLHGGGGNAANAVMMTGFDRLAERDGVIAVYPDGTARRDRHPAHVERRALLRLGDAGTPLPTTSASSAR